MGQANDNTHVACLSTTSKSWKTLAHAATVQLPGSTEVAECTEAQRARPIACALASDCGSSMEVIVKTTLYRSGMHAAILVCCNALQACEHRDMEVSAASSIPKWGPKGPVQSRSHGSSFCLGSRLVVTLARLYLVRCLEGSIIVPRVLPFCSWPGFQVCAKSETGCIRDNQNG